MKPRNHTLAVILKNDPARYRARVVETKKRKFKIVRAKRKTKDEKERDEDLILSEFYRLYGGKLTFSD
jgi:hypothetical protein